MKQDSPVLIRGVPSGGGPMKRKHATRSRSSALLEQPATVWRHSQRNRVIEDAWLTDVSVGLKVGFDRETHSTTSLFGPRNKLVRSPQAETILGLISALNAKDPYTARHSIRVESYARCIAKRLKLGPEITKMIRIAALLHDIGKIGIADSILTKKGPLTETEFETMKEHPALGASILGPIHFMDPLLPLVVHHHEWFDGNGYPAGLSADAIPFGAKVIQAADCVDAMMWPRSYRTGFPISKIITEFEEGSGSQFDPNIARITIEWLHEYSAIMESQLAKGAGYD